jgi:hypothetical protein
VLGYLARKSDSSLARGYHAARTISSRLQEREISIGREDRREPRRPESIKSVSSFDTIT